MGLTFTLLPKQAVSRKNFYLSISFPFSLCIPSFEVFLLSVTIEHTHTVHTFYV